MADEAPPAPESKDERRRRARSSKQAQGSEGADGAPALDGFLLMDSALDKLKLLDYDSKFCKKYNLNPIHKFYFAVSTDPSEQLHYLACLTAWLLSFSGHDYPAPDQYDDPNTICANLVHALKKAGVADGVSSSVIRAGCGPEVCSVVNSLASAALQGVNWQWQKPRYPREAADAEETVDESLEVGSAAGGGDGGFGDRNGLDDDDDDDDDGIADIVGMTEDGGESSDVSPFGVKTPAIQNILKADMDAAAWRTEVERVLPELKVQIRADHKDWRAHLSNMEKHQAEIKGSLTETHTHLDKLHEEISRTLEKIDNREKYINKQLEAIATEYRLKQDTLAATVETYRQSSGTVTELTQRLAELSDELDRVKAQMDERGTSMTDTGPLVKIKQSLTRLKKDTTQMDLRIGVVQHQLMSAQMRNKNAMVVDMNRTSVFEESDF